MRIYYDGYQEGQWFRGLHQELEDLPLQPFPTPPANPKSALEIVLSYDRPDIVLTDAQDNPLLVVERTIEVPSGHNVGQRFARIAQAARCGVPAIYFGPYSAYKHGGDTRGPRYMNLRLFKAIDAVMEVEKSPITTIRWPVDDDWEIIHGPEKDARMREYMVRFMDLLSQGATPAERRLALLNSEFEHAQEVERREFVESQVRHPEQYDRPPNSVQLGPASHFAELTGAGLGHAAITFYNIGMNYIRSDPYTGMAILYAYLYCGGMQPAARHRKLVLHMPRITSAMWDKAAGTGARKDIRLYREVADGVLFQDAFRLKITL